MKYYRLRQDMYVPNMWYLGDISGVDNWKLFDTVPAIRGPLEIELYRDGVPLDFTQTNAFALPIVSEKTKEALDCFPELEFVPVNVAANPGVGRYYVMVVTKSVDCVDEERSEFEKYVENDPVRPDKAGAYSGFFEMHLDPEKISGIDVFRLKKFEVAIIVSERAREKLEAVGATGMKLVEVA